MSWKRFLPVAALIILGIGIWRFRPPAQPDNPSHSHLKEVTVADLRGLMAARKITLINLWASWCEPCKAEFPDLMKLRSQYLPSGLQVLFVSADSKSDRPEAERFLDSVHIDFETYVAAGAPEQLGIGLDPRWQGAVPSTFLFSSEGKLIDSWQGAAEFEDFEEKVRPLLEQ